MAHHLLNRTVDSRRPDVIATGESLYSPVEWFADENLGTSVWLPATRTVGKLSGKKIAAGLGYVVIEVAAWMVINYYFPSSINLHQFARDQSSSEILMQSLSPGGQQARTQGNRQEHLYI